MVSWLFRTVSVFLLGGCLTAQASISLPLENGQTIKLYENSYALLIGVSDYKYWPDLPGVQNDIAITSRELKKHGFKVKTLLNPTRVSFDAGIREFIADYGQNPENRLIIYYGGHGHTLTTKRGRELGYIIPADAPLPSKGVGAFKAKAISMLEIEIFAKQMEAKHAMFLFDSCFSGSLFEISRGVPESISAKTAEPVRQFITAGTAEQTVPDKSVFRSQFVAGLEGEADLNKDGFITGTELAQFIEDSVTNYTRRAQTPLYGKIRDPILDKGDFVFINPKMKITINVKGAKITTPAVSTVDPVAIELAYWDSVKDSHSVTAYRSYLQKYPQGQFSDIAQILIKQQQQSSDKQQGASVTEELRKQRKAEEQRLAELRKEQQVLEREKAEVKKQQLALLRQPKSVMAHNAGPQKIVFLSRFRQFEWQAYVSPPTPEFSRLVNETGKEFFKHQYPSADVITIFDIDLLKKIKFQDTDNPVASRRLCDQYKADFIMMMDMERTGISYELDTTLHECHNNQLVSKYYNLDWSETRKYDFDLSIEGVLEKIYQRYLREMTFSKAGS